MRASHSAPIGGLGSASFTGQGFMSSILRVTYLPNNRKVASRGAAITTPRIPSRLAEINRAGMPAGSEFLFEVAHFFEVYKDLEGMRTKPVGWENCEAAQKEVIRSIKLFDDRFTLGGL